MALNGQFCKCVYFLAASEHHSHEIIFIGSCIQINGAPLIFAKTNLTRIPPLARDCAITIFNCFMSDSWAVFPAAHKKWSCSALAI